MPERFAGVLELVVVQASPFCNIDCDYCYLPHRTERRRMSTRCLERLFDDLFASGLVRESFTIVWHAGEPLAVPVSWYEDAFARIAERCPSSVKVAHSIQTNAMLIDDAWCELFARHRVSVGVSVDGPAALHDSRRKTRKGAGTHEVAMRGVSKLAAHSIPFHVISVLTREALAQPDALFDFYVANDFRRVAFNVEEVEGINTTSSLQATDIEPLYRSFMARMLELVRTRASDLVVREFHDVAFARAETASPRGNQQVRPLAIVSVDAHGNLSSFSPELLGMSTPRYESFCFGNVLEGTLADMVEHPSFIDIEREISEGVKRCASECEYFSMCGGGAPSNKLFENGSFATTETLYCKLHKQALIDAVLTDVESVLDAVEATGAAVSRVVS